MPTHTRAHAHAHTHTYIHTQWHPKCGQEILCSQSILVSLIVTFIKMSQHCLFTSLYPLPNCFHISWCKDHIYLFIIVPALLILVVWKKLLQKKKIVFQQFWKTPGNKNINQNSCLQNCSFWISQRQYIVLTICHYKTTETLFSEKIHFILVAT